MTKITIDREVVERVCTEFETHGMSATFLEFMATLRAALSQPGQVAGVPCWCTTCRPITMDDMRFVTCPDCGNKRCPKAHNHALACTGSNEVGQPGSSWENVKPAAPQPLDKLTALSEDAKGYDDAKT